MAISLTKGQSFVLCDDNGNALKNLTVGLGWDEAAPKKGGILGMFSKQETVDCDATVLMCKDGIIHGIDDVVFYDSLKHKSGSVEHKGDNRSGKGDGDDEQIIIHPLDIPAEYDRLIFIVNIFEPVPRKQHFGMIRNAFIRFIDNDSSNEICRFDLTEDYSNQTAMVMGELRREGSNWKFNALGEGTTDTCLEDVVMRFSK